MDQRDVGCLVTAASVIVVGTLSTGWLPPTAPYQVLAGGIIVLGFAMLLYCFRSWD